MEFLFGLVFVRHVSDINTEIESVATTSSAWTVDVGDGNVKHNEHGWGMKSTDHHATDPNMRNRDAKDSSIALTTLRQSVHGFV